MSSGIRGYPVFVSITRLGLVPALKISNRNCLGAARNYQCFFFFLIRNNTDFLEPTHPPPNLQKKNLKVHLCNCPSDSHSMRSYQTVHFLLRSFTSLFFGKCSKIGSWRTLCQRTLRQENAPKFKAGPPWFEFLVIFDFFAPWYRRSQEASAVKIS